MSSAAPQFQQFAFSEESNGIDGARNETDPPLNATYIDLSCFLNVIDNVTVEFDLEDEWLPYRQAVQPDLEIMANCTVAQ